MREENDNSRDEQQAKLPIEIQAVAGTTTKRRGESAEAESISKAISLGFSVLKPWGTKRPLRRGHRPRARLLASAGEVQHLPRRVTRPAGAVAQGRVLHASRDRFRGR